LEHYFHEALRKDADFSALDTAAVARDGDADAICALLELLAAAAVSCDNKAEYVQRIMSLSPESQLEMKSVIERSMSRLSDYADSDDEDGDENELVFGNEYEDDDGDDDDDASQDRGNSKLFGGPDDGGDLEQMLADAKRELATLKSQSAMTVEDHERGQTKLKALVEDLQDRLEKKQEQLTLAENELQSTTTELEDVRNKLKEANEEKAQLADDLDVANAKAHQLHKAEATLVAYKKKLEAVGGMNQQMTDLEDQAANYLRQIMELEAEVKKSNALQKSNTDLQEKIARLEKENSDLEASSKSSASDLAELKQQLKDAERSKKLFEDELNELRAAQQATAGIDDVTAALPTSPASTSSAMQEAQTKEQREKLMRLEIENQKLKDEIEKMRTAEAARVEAAAVASASDSAEVTNLKSELSRLQEELAAKQKENAKITGDKDKLEAYTKRTLAKFQDKYLVALQECKAKLKEKQDKIEALETRSVSERNAQKREERLLSSTIYELGMAIMQARLKER